MITKEYKKQRMCLFCASDYHLELILLPYIKERIEKEDFVVLTENNLTNSLNILLEKTNLSEELKDKIRKIDWKSKEYLKNTKNSSSIVNVIINGNVEFINKKNKIVQELKNDNLKVINCFHISDQNVNIEKISQDYEYILNTNKL